MQKAKFVLSKEKVIEQFNKVEGIADIISYSSKTNPIITPILEEQTNCVFSIHTKEELKHVKDKSRVWFLTQAWNEKDIKKLLDMGVNSFVVDNDKDLEVLSDFLNNNDVTINLLLRIKLREMSLKTERYYVFGMDCREANIKLRELRKNKNIKQLGVHVHRKTQNMSEWRLDDAFSEMLEPDVLEFIDLINIGGGIPAHYANTNEDVIRTVLNKITQIKKWLNEKNIKMILEPGRFIAAPSIKLITHIKSIYGKTIVVDVSVYNADMDALIIPVKLIVEGELENGQEYVIKGSTPCSLDLFRYRVYLDNPKVGDELVFLNAGAYNFTTDFCDLPRIGTVIE